MEEKALNCTLTVHQYFPEHFTLFSSFSPMSGYGKQRKPCVCEILSEFVLLA